MILTGKRTAEQKNAMDVADLLLFTNVTHSAEADDRKNRGTRFCNQARPGAGEKKEKKGGAMWKLKERGIEGS